MSQSFQPIVAEFSARSLLERYFYFAMALLMVVVVFYGFSFTVGDNLIHAAVPRPTVLYVHAATFVAWLGMFTLQSALIRSRNIRLHKQLGQAGVVLGCAVFVLGLATIVAMARFHARYVVPGAPPPGFAAIPLNDMAAFAGCFGAAVLLRRKPEYHRRLMLMATAALTAAGWGRFPQIPDTMFYLGVDGLIMLGVARDLFVMRRVHRVYLYVLPAMVAGQIAALAVAISQPAWFMALVHAAATGG